MITTSRPQQAYTIHPELTRSTVSKPRGGDWLFQTGRNLFWIAISLVVSAAALEFLFSLIGAGQEEYIKLDPVMGITHLENKQVTFRSEGFSNEKTNAAGQRDHHHNRTKPPGLIRIAFLGDSKTEALQVPTKDTFAQLLEDKLNSAGSPKVEVLNFGMAGYSTGQEYIQYLHQVRGYQPDITVLMYDILDSDENVHPGVIQETSFPRPYFAFDSTGELKIDWSVLDHYLRGDRAHIALQSEWLRRNSRIWGVMSRFDSNQKADKLYQTIATPFRAGISHLTAMVAPNRITTPNNSTIEIRNLLDREVKQRPNVAEVVQEKNTRAQQHAATKTCSAETAMFNTYLKSHNYHFGVTMSLIECLSKSCKASGSRLVVASLPAPSNSMFYFRELRGLNELCTRAEIPFVELHEQFPLMESGQPNQYHLQSHFSKEGHRKVTDLLFPMLSKQVKAVAETHNGSQSK